ncbi:MAG: hypothetical protein ACJLUP_13095 [Agrobacterium tumefaciens]
MTSPIAFIARDCKTTSVWCDALSSSMPGEKFRTPPLLNVTKTAPYSHSGPVADLGDAIRFHVDPLALYDATRFTDAQRVEYYSSLKSWSREPLVGIALDNEEIDDLVAFLATLEYDSATQVEETD